MGIWPEQARPVQPGVFAAPGFRISGGNGANLTTRHGRDGPDEFRSNGRLHRPRVPPIRLPNILVWVQHSSPPDDHVIPSRSAPPPRAGPAVGSWRSGLSATSVSVVRIRPATEAALRSATMPTFAGSITPEANRSPNVPVRASSPVPAGAAPTRATTTSGSRPALAAMVASGRASAYRTSAAPS